MRKTELIDIVAETIAGHDMLPDAQLVPTSPPVVLMVSGGSDSVALARLLPKVCKQAQFTILHINHQLRGKDADEDESFVVRLARELKLSCEVRRFDVAKVAAETGTNTEHAGRELRYKAANELLDRLCAKQGINPSLGRIATAHTLDDRAETFFMRAIVGAGAGALSSIPYMNGRVIRPLLDLSREQLRVWLLEVPGKQSKKEPWREDITNEDTGKLRAFVRHELIPIAKKRNPDLLATMAQSLDNLAADDALLTKLVEQLEQRFLTCGDKGSYKIDAALFGEDEALVKRIVHRTCKKVLPLQDRITAIHVNTIATQGANSNFAIDLPGNARVVNKYGVLTFYPPAKNTQQNETDPSLNISLVEGEPLQLPDGRQIVFTKVDSGLFKQNPVAYARTFSTSSHVFVCGDKLANAVLFASYIQPGDRFCPLGMKGKHKLVSDVLIDKKIPEQDRAHIIKVTLSTCENIPGEPSQEIIWLVDIQLDERFKVSDATTTMFSILVS